MKTKTFFITVLICINLIGLVSNLFDLGKAGAISMAVFAVDILVAAVYLVKLK